MSQLPCSHDAEQELAVVGDEAWCAECDRQLEVECEAEAREMLKNVHNWRPVPVIYEYADREEPGEDH